MVTRQILTTIFGKTKVKAFLLPTETLGYTVDNAVNENTFTAMSVLKNIGDSRIASMVNERRPINSRNGGNGEELNRAHHQMAHRDRSGKRLRTAGIPGVQELNL